MNNKRWEKVIINMKDRGCIDEMIISSPAYIFYLMGIWVNSEDRMAVIHLNSLNEKTLIINQLFKNFIRKTDINVKYYDDSEDAVKILSEYIDADKIIGIDKNWPSGYLIKLMEKRTDLKFVNSSFILDNVRMIKDKEEIDKLRNAAGIADKVTDDLILNIHNEPAEREMADTVKKLFGKYKSDKLAFEPTIAFGENSGNVAHTAGERHLKQGDAIIIDIGGVTDNYCSDITRTFFYGQPEEEAKKIYQIVLEANLAAISEVRPGAKFSDIDRAARKVIEDNGYGEYFTHRTGHSIGIEGHEYPSVSSVNEMILQPGMVFSIEPGIYIPDKYGVRIEDIVIVTETGTEVLNKSPKKLKIL